LCRSQTKCGGNLFNSNFRCVVLDMFLIWAFQYLCLIASFLALSVSLQRCGIVRDHRALFSCLFVFVPCDIVWSCGFGTRFSSIPVQADNNFECFSFFALFWSESDVAVHLFYWRFWILSCLCVFTI
jgi:hypothetical protein